MGDYPVVSWVAVRRGCGRTLQLAIFREGKKTVGPVFQAVGDDVNNVDIPLDAPLYKKQSRLHDDAAVGLHRLRPDDNIGDTGFILDGYEANTLCAAGSLADQDQACKCDLLSVSTVL